MCCKYQYTFPIKKSKQLSQTNESAQARHSHTCTKTAGDVC